MSFAFVSAIRKLYFHEKSKTGLVCFILNKTQIQHLEKNFVLQNVVGIVDKSQAEDVRKFTQKCRKTGILFACNEATKQTARARKLLLKTSPGKRSSESLLFLGCLSCDGIYKWRRNKNNSKNLRCAKCNTLALLQQQKKPQQTN